MLDRSRLPLLGREGSCCTRRAWLLTVRPTLDPSRGQEAAVLQGPPLLCVGQGRLGNGADPASSTSLGGREAKRTGASSQLHSAYASCPSPPAGPPPPHGSVSAPLCAVRLGAWHFPAPGPAFARELRLVQRPKLSLSSHVVPCPVGPLHLAQQTARRFQHPLRSVPIREAEQAEPLLWAWRVPGALPPPFPPPRWAFSLQSSSTGPGLEPGASSAWGHPGSF